MEDKIEVGEYVRTREGYIIKVDENTNIFNLGYKEQYVDMETTKYGFTCEEEIVKHRKQLIDLIECGDIVNRHLVIDKYEDVDEYGNDFWCLIIEDDSLLNRSIREEKIKTILTRESYMANCYKAGGEDGI